MTPPRTIIGSILDISWFRSPLRRRLTFAIAALILGVLCLWPRHYLAKANLMPNDAVGGLSALLGGGGLGGLLSVGEVLGTHQSIEADLTIARSQAVLRDVVARTHLVGRTGFGDSTRTEIKLRKKVEIVAIRGSILQLTVRDADPAFARALLASYIAAIQDRLANLNRELEAQKRVVATNRMNQATIRLANAQTAIAKFRSANKLPAPEAQLGGAVSRLASLQAQSEAKQVELQTLQQFATANNIQVKSVQAEISSLQGQIAQAQADTRLQGNQSLAAMASQNVEYLNLYREQRFSEALYTIYEQALEKLTIEQLSSDVTMIVIEPPYIDPSRQFNIPAVGALVLLLVLGVCAEFYIVAPPAGRKG